MSRYFFHFFLEDTRILKTYVKDHAEVTPQRLQNLDVSGVSSIA